MTLTDVRFEKEHCIGQNGYIDPGVTAQCKLVSPAGFDNDGNLNLAEHERIE